MRLPWDWEGNSRNPSGKGWCFPSLRRQGTRTTLGRSKIKLKKKLRERGGQNVGLTIKENCRWGVVFKKDNKGGVSLEK